MTHEQHKASRATVNRKLAAYSAAAGAAMLTGAGVEAGVHHTLVPDGEFTVDDPLAVILEGATTDFAMGAIDYSRVDAVMVQDTASRFAVMGSAISSGGPVMASMLSPGQMIGENPSTLTYHAAIFHYTHLGKSEGSICYGDWAADGDTGFFGFSFVSEETGDTLFGWGRFQRLSSTSGRLVDWAYEDSGDPIPAGFVPEPGSLGLLALGAAGIAAMRRKRRQA